LPRRTRPGLRWVVASGRSPPDAAGRVVGTVRAYAMGITTAHRTFGLHWSGRTLESIFGCSQSEPPAPLAPESVLEDPSSNADSGVLTSSSDFWAASTPQNHSRMAAMSINTVAKR